MNILIFIGMAVIIPCIIGYYIPIGGGKQSVEYFDKTYTTVSKGIAILLIMVCHCGCHWEGARLLTPCGGIGVSMFLITSGYGLNESFKHCGLRQFWKKRLGRVYLPYMICVLLFAVTMKWNGKQCVMNFLCIQNPYWFVTYIIGCYIIYWLTTKFMYKYRMVILMALSIMAVIFLPGLQAEQSFGFITGIWLSENRQKLLLFRQRRNAYVGVAFSLLCIGMLFLALKQLPIVRSEASGISMNVIQCLIKYPLGLGILLAMGLSNKILTNRFLYLSGIISYELYLMHFPFYQLIGIKLWPALLLMVGSYAGAYLFYRVNNKVHSIITA